MNILYKTLKKKKTKKNMHKPDIINTRVRKTIKEIIREEYNNTIMKKEKYDTIKKYSSKTSKHSTQIIRTKMYTYENERKMMVRMIHDSLPICEKINRIVKKEKGSRYNNDFYSNKYEKYTNNGICPCCNKEIETVEHLFAHCDNEEVKQMRHLIHANIYDVMKKKLGPGTPPPKTFFYDKNNQNNKPNDSRNLLLGNLGIIPTETEKYIEELLDEDNKGKLKYILCDISQAIMTQNIEIWKYRCKKLYGRINNQNPP